MASLVMAIFGSGSRDLPGAASLVKVSCLLLPALVMVEVLWRRVVSSFVFWVGGFCGFVVPLAVFYRFVDFSGFWLVAFGGF